MAAIQRKGVTARRTAIALLAETVRTRRARLAATMGQTRRDPTSELRLAAVPGLQFRPRRPIRGGTAGADRRFDAAVNNWSAAGNAWDAGGAEYAFGEDLEKLEGAARLLGSRLSDAANQFFLLHSESCVPIRTFSHVYRELFRLGQSWLNYHQGSMERYARIDRRAVRERHFYKASQFFCLIRPHVELILANSDLSAWSSAVIADEHYVPTLLAMCGRLGEVCAAGPDLHGVESFAPRFGLEPGNFS